MKYLLLGTSGCHLCEWAEELVNDYLAGKPEVRLELVDIAEQTQWQAAYATLIPVLLQEPGNKFLNWPFTQDDVLAFIEQQND